MITGLRMGIGRYGRTRPPAPVPGSRTPAAVTGSARTSADEVYAVRLDWADGIHEFVGPESDAAEARRRQAGVHARWRRSPWRPRLSLVTMSEHDFHLHARGRPDCTAPDCPTAADRAVRW
jgi:hypothetical protein